MTKDVEDALVQKVIKDLRIKETRRVMKIPESVMLKANNTDLTADSSLFEKIVRTYFDPAHAGNYARAPWVRDRTCIKTSNTRVPITTVANQATFIISTPYLECPFIKSLDGGNTWTAIYPGGFNKAHAAYSELKAEAVMGIGKSMKITFDTPDQTRQDMFLEGRLDPLFNDYNVIDGARYGLNPAGASVDYGSANHAVGKQDAVNQRVIQNIPSNLDVLGPLITQKKGGSYLVNTLSSYEFNYLRKTSDACLWNDEAILPLNTTQMNALRLGKIGELPANGSYNVTYGQANPYGAASNVVVSKPLMFDMTFFYIPAKQNAQSINFEGFEHYQYITADAQTLSGPMIIEPYDMPNIELFMRKMSNEMPFTYPAEFNDWGSVWKWIKNKASGVADFYQTNSKILKPALSLIPGAATALDIAEKIF